MHEGSMNDGCYPNVCEACGEAGPHNFCADCYGFFHDQCIESQSHRCLEPEESGFYDSQNRWVKE